MKVSLQFFAGAPDDYPHLNKCPDCETFFADLTCPLCGKVCPEEMRAGNRKASGQKWEDPYSRGSGRVQFVPWYFSTVFIIAMLLIFPLVGIILLWMGPWKKKWKILATVLFCLWTAMPFILGTVGMLLLQLISTEDVPVDLNTPESAYVELCQQSNADAVDIFRNPDTFASDYVEMTVTVGDVFQNYNASQYRWYYRCTAEAEGREYTFLMWDFREEGSPNLTSGDRITVYGQVMGNVEIQTYEEVLRGPCIAMRFAVLEESPATLRGLSDPPRLCLA